jgi:hypothetical protein
MSVNIHMSLSGLIFGEDGESFEPGKGPDYEVGLRDSGLPHGERQGEPNMHILRARF